MDNYQYINDKPMDFICNGVPSHLHKGMKVKERLIKYMLEKHPNFICKVEDVKPAVVPIVKSPPVNKVVEPEVQKDVELESLSNFFSEISQSQDEPKESSLKNTDKDTDTESSDSFDEIDAILENTSPKSKLFDLKTLKTFKNIKFMSREEMDSVCNQLDIEYTSKVTTAKKIAKILGIPAK